MTMGDTDPPTPQDSLIFQAIDEHLTSDPPDVDQAVYKMLPYTGVPMDVWFANWTKTKGNRWSQMQFTKKLLAAHAHRKYQPAIERLAGNDIASPDPLFSANGAQKLEDTMYRILSPLRRNMEILVSGGKGFRMWSPKTGGEFEDFLASLRIPVDTEMKPDMLLHELGRLEKDPRFHDRLEEIFQSDSRSHKFLVNTSGSGKTRLLLEGLCKHWGIYFTAKRDTLHHGSHDMQNIIDTVLLSTPGFSECLSESLPENFQRDLELNRQIARGHFSYLMLARLRVFRMFLETIEAISAEKRDSEDEYRKRWLELQIQPSMLGDHRDIFHYLTSTLILEFAGQMSEFELAHCINNELRYISSKCALPSQQPATINQTDSRSDPDTSFVLFIVVDEVQHAVEEHFDAFRSHSSDKGKQLLPRPVFRELLHAWLGILGFIIVAAGTGVDGDVLEETMRSAVAKHKQYRSLHDTGAFDGKAIDLEAVNAQSIHGQSTQFGYILRFIPPKLREIHIYVALVLRMSYWLRGRFRFTAGFISELLAAEFKYPHETLNEYIYQLTLPPKRKDRTLIDTLNSIHVGFIATDGAQYIDKSVRRVLSKRTTFNFEKLTNPIHSNKLATIIKIAVQFWLRYDLGNMNIGRFEADFVQWGFAMFRTDEKSQLASGRMDEPIVLLALGQWLNAGFSETIYHKLATNIGTHTALGVNTLENYLAFCFTGLFNWGSRRLDEIFLFPKGVPKWANQTAQLVSLYKESPQLELEESSVGWWSRPSYSLGTHCTTADSTVEWLKHAARAPICFPPILFGPDLLFILRLEDGTRIWVAVQSKYESTSLLEAKKLVGGIQSVTPANYFSSNPNDQEKILKHLLKLPGRRDDLGKYSLLRVIVSFPGETRVSRGKNLTNSHFYDDEHPLAVLNMQYLAAMTRNMEPKHFLTTIENAPLFVGHEYIKDEAADNWFPKDLHSTNVDILGKAYLKRRKEAASQQSDTEGENLPGPSKKVKLTATKNAFASSSGTQSQSLPNPR
ncbi:hypothetical protein C8R44DRAFT_882038 [Mycena epipterygia]|nr:hypothetical protein C8R44DRAFT_882038 [Mycena epipterygia]